MRISEPYAAGIPKRFVIQGNFLRVASISGLAAGSVSVQFFRDGKLLNIDLDRVDAGDWARTPETFDAIQVTSSVAQTVELQVNRGDVGSDRVTGTVSVVDGGAARSLASRAFWAHPQAVPGVAAQYSHAQLWNPANSTVNLVVNQAALYHGTAGLVIYVRNSTAALATAYPAPIPKLLGSAVVSQALARVEFNAVIQGSSAIASLIPQNQYDNILTWTEPMVIPPGRGLVFVAGAPNVGLYCRIEYWEQDL